MTRGAMTVLFTSFLLSAGCGGIPSQKSEPSAQLDDGTADIRIGATVHPPSDPQAQLDLVAAPPAPDGAAARPVGDAKGAVSILAASPTILPGANFEYVAPGGYYSCATGTLCTGVWDPNADKWKVFKLYYCATYALSDWNGDGFYWDNQSGNPVSIFYGQFMNELRRIHPGAGQTNYNWDPAYFIKNC